MCYEVKITEEIKWEDLAKIAERRQDSRRGQKRDRDKRGKKSGDDKKTEKPAESKDKVKTEEKSDEKTDSTENGEKDNADAAAAKESVENNEGEEKKEEGTTVKMETTEEEKPAEKIEETPMETESGATGEVEKKPEDAEKKEGEKAEGEKKEPEEQIPIHLIRVGWSLLSSSLQLGEDKCSYAYESTGKFVNDKQFIDYGKPFAVGDVIGAYLVSYLHYFFFFLNIGKLHHDIQTHLVHPY